MYSKCTILEAIDVFSFHEKKTLLIPEGEWRMFALFGIATILSDLINILCITLDFKFEKVSLKLLAKYQD